MTIADSPTYLSEPSVDRAYGVIQQAAQDVLGGMTSQPIRVTFEGRRTLAPDDIAALGDNVLVELQFERPAEVHHGVVILAGAADLTRLFDLAAASSDEVIDAESLLSLGDIVSTFLDSLVGELTWLQPTPRAWLANLEPLPATGAELPDLIARDDPLYVADVILTGTDGLPCRLHLVFGEGTERALLGLDFDAVSVAEQEPDGEVDTAVTSASSTSAASLDEAPAARGGAEVAARQSAPAPVHAAQFKPLGPEQTNGRGQSIDLIKDVPLHVSVELGRASMTVREILALGPSSVVQLDRLAGEAVDILVNDRLIAHGEVVIVDESFGVRITEIVRDAGRRSAQ